MTRLALLAVLFSAAASAQPSGLAHDVAAAFEASDYSALLVITFQDPLDVGRCVDVTQMLTVSRFTPETFVGICHLENGGEAFAADPERNLYSAGLADDGETWAVDSARAVPVAWHRASLGAATADCVGAAWDRAIRTAQYGGPGDAIDVDGDVDYFLRAGPGEDVVTAHAAGPDPASVAGAMRALGLRIGAFARGATTAGQVRAGCDELNASIDRLDP